VSIHYAVFSPCIQSLPEGLPEDTLYTELKKAILHLGIDPANVTTFDYPVRELMAQRQAILEDLVALNKEIKPDLVFLPCSNDIHQDHLLIHQEGKRAFKNVKMLGYELPWNNFEFDGNFFVELDKSHIDAKISAVNEYSSQSFRNYADKEFFFSLGRVRGTQIKCQYAECFELIRWIA